MKISVLMITVDRCLCKLFAGMQAAFGDRDNGIVGPQCLRCLFGDRLCHGRVVATGHIDQQNVVWTEDIDKQGSGDGTVDAAGKPDGHFADACLFKETLAAVAEAMINLIDLTAGIRGDVAGVDSFGFAVPAGAERSFCIHGRIGEQPAVRVVNTAAAVKGEDVFAVVLDPYIIAVDERDAGFLRGAAE